MAEFGYRGGGLCVNWRVSSLVIWGEYYFSKKIWPVFLAVGLTLLAGALFCKGKILSPLLSIAGFCSLWSIKELFEQEKRVQKGWFAKNPNRK